LQGKVPFQQFAEMKAADQHDVAAVTGPPAASSDGTVAPGGPHRITLLQAQQQAAAASNPMAHLAQLQVEAARQHRLGAESDYFPKISSTLTNFHFNKFMGEEFSVERPVRGGTITAQIPLAGKSTLGASFGALSARNADQSGLESRMSRLIVPLNGLAIFSLLVGQILI
jgi:outer membrane protein TolC